MGNFQLPFMFYIKYITALILMTFLYVPYWIIKMFSKKSATAYMQSADVPINKLDDWINK